MRKIKEYFTKKEDFTFVGTQFDFDSVKVLYVLGMVCTGVVIGMGINIATGSAIIKFI